MKHFVSIAQTPVDELMQVFDLAFELREQRQRGEANPPVLRGKTLAMIFEKPSLRTRVSFEQAMLELGGAAIVLNQQGVGLGVVGSRLIHIKDRGGRRYTLTSATLRPLTMLAARAMSSARLLTHETR